MWPFSRKPPDISKLAPIDSDTYEWSVALAETEEGPLIVSKNSGAKRWAKHTELPIKLGFAVPLNQQNPGALPDPDENKQLAQIEDMIVQSINPLAKGLHALTITNGVMKEFIFYINEGVDIAGLHQAVQERCATHEIQCMAERDSDWSVYSQF